MKLNTERIHTIWHLTWPQCIMLLCQFVIGITDVWAGGRNGAGATVYPMVSFSFAVWAVRLPIAWLFGHIIWQDASGVFLSTFVSQVVMSLSLLWVTLRCNWTRFALAVRPHTCASR